MDATADDRLRSVVLFGAAAAVLVVGGWWWRAAAPASTAGTGIPSAAALPSVGPSVSTRMERLLAAAQPDERLTVRMDPDTGEVLRVRSGPRLVIDPATGSISDIEGDPRALFSAGDLPLFQETIWREQRDLAPGQEVTRQAGNHGARYLLQYRCTRPGTMAVTSDEAKINGPVRIDCDGTIANAEVLPGGGPFQVSLSAVDRPIDIEAQLVALPPHQ
ncbi:MULTISPECIES: hypothetical protein [Micromonospora]|uniref:hypothetical protein n=1 Tax=Micromonospora TaxID=1873 RepID=UPI001EE8BBB3|nr:hypothetical protein [Micromonospora hortensis]MCG5452746.1 hypothetical protein [Micromonospora hortensis]WTI07971.1 hypothetical protein OHB44_32205 [Micromonospora sp. NBC_00821]